MLTIHEIEAEINRVGSLMATAELQYEESGCFSDKGQVSAYELQIRKLADAREQQSATETGK